MSEIPIEINNASRLSQKRVGTSKAMPEFSFFRQKYFGVFGFKRRVANFFNNETDRVNPYQEGIYELLV